MDTLAALPATPAPRTTRILRTLGIVGFDALEPVILAALATETPLLLIGPHGTAKSLLLTRLCEAMGLVGRHYNASLVNYDDLIGYPLPDDAGRLRFVQTPASVWDAEAVFIDELSRARADMLNRLFPIIHERKVQGMPLARLRYRWAAMNPPANPDAEASDDAGYLGSEPLDPALADRFGFVVEVPAWKLLADADQLAVITSTDGPVPETARHALAAALSEIAHELPILEDCSGPVVAKVVRDMMHHAATAGVPLSGRRASMLYRNILAVHAARSVAHPASTLEDSSWTAVAASIPQRAQGKPVDLARLMVAHAAVWKTVNLSDTDPRRILAREHDPVRRAVRAIGCPQLSMQERSAYVADALAHLPPGGRHALGHALVESGAVAGLVAAVAEQCATLFALVARAQDVAQLVPPGSAVHKAWKSAMQHVASLPKDDPSTILVRNLIAGLWAKGQLQTERDVAAVIRSWEDTRPLVAA
jgi:MoxR-like ATPase